MMMMMRCVGYRTKCNVCRKPFELARLIYGVTLDNYKTEFTCVACKYPHKMYMY